MKKMFQLERYYEQAHSGEKVDATELLSYLGSFESIVLWGASFLGKAVGSYLQKRGLHVTQYWDLRADELKCVNGIPVCLPFSAPPQDGRLIVFCIGNQVIKNRLLTILTDKGYCHVIEGDFLYEGILCPFDKTTGIRAARCSGTMECRQVYCKRLGNILRAKCKSARPLHLTSVTLIVNSRCSLRCRCCTSYLNAYPPEKRENIPLERILQDIDAFFAAVDTVGTVTVMGGEPFMHPDISPIIRKLAAQENLGLISIATSGTFPIQKEQLLDLHHEKVNVSFSNYTATIAKQQQEIFHKNIALLQQEGVLHTVGLVSPEWIVPSTLYFRAESDAKKARKKSACTHWPQIKNGKVHPCDFATAVYSLDVASYASDYVDLTQAISPAALKETLRDFLDKPFYQTCGHHVFSKKMSRGAEQGYTDFLRPRAE